MNFDPAHPPEHIEVFCYFKVYSENIWVYTNETASAHHGDHRCYKLRIPLPEELFDEVKIETIEGEIGNRVEQQFEVKEVTE